MGQSLSEPVTDKTTSSGGNDSLLYAISDMQGWRISMEDSHATILDLKNAEGDIVGSFFGVYDGHGGKLPHLPLGAIFKRRADLTR